MRVLESFLIRQCFVAVRWTPGMPWKTQVKFPASSCSLPSPGCCGLLRNELADATSLSFSELSVDKNKYIINYFKEYIH